MNKIKTISILLIFIISGVLGLVSSQENLFSNETPTDSNAKLPYTTLESIVILVISILLLSLLIGYRKKINLTGALIGGAYAILPAILSINFLFGGSGEVNLATPYFMIPIFWLQIPTYFLSYLLSWLIIGWFSSEQALGILITVINVLLWVKIGSFLVSKPHKSWLMWIIGFLGLLIGFFVGYFYFSSLTLVTSILGLIIGLIIGFLVRKHMD